MTQGNGNDKRAEIVPISAADSAQAETPVDESQSATPEDDRDAAIISAMIGAARDWH